jgi:hypothetical protein
MVTIALAGLLAMEALAEGPSDKVSGNWPQWRGSFATSFGRPMTVSLGLQPGRHGAHGVGGGRRGLLGSHTITTHGAQCGGPADKACPPSAWVRQKSWLLTPFRQRYIDALGLKNLSPLWCCD